MKVYVEHAGEIYMHEGGLDGVTPYPVAIGSAEKKINRDSCFEPGTFVYFDGVGWTKTGPDNVRLTCRSCEGCIFQSGAPCDKINKYGAAFCRGVIFIKLPETAGAPQVGDTDENKNDPVNHPAHYTSHPSGVECITITEHHDFCTGNAIKYLWRQGLKDGASNVEDLEKAIWYIRREIEKIKAAAK